MLRVLPLYLAIMASFLNLFLLIPITPLHARHLTPDLVLVAMAVSAYSWTNLGGNLFAGMVVDRYPRALTMVSGLLLGGVGLLIAALSPEVGGVIAGLMINGLGLSVVTPAAYALLSQTLPPDDRVAGMARSGATIGLAAMLGPPLAGGMADAWGAAHAYGLIACFLALTALGLWLTLRGLPDQAETEVGVRDVGSVLLAPGLRQAYLGAFALMFMNGSLVYALPPAARSLGFGGAMTGMLFSAFALSAILVMLAPWGIRLTQTPAGMAVGALGLATGAALLGLGTQLPYLLGCMALYGAGFGVLFASSIASLASRAPAQQQGTAFGVFYAVFSLGAIAGPLTLAQLPQAPPFAVAALVPAALGFGLGLRALRSGRRSR